MTIELKKIALIIPSLHTGGMEKVMSNLANYLNAKDDVKVYLILLIKSNKFYKISPEVTLIEPAFNTPSSLIGKFKILKYLRTTLKDIKPFSILSFGSMYNSFVMLASIGLKGKYYLSDRSNPYRNSFKSLIKKNNYISDGLLHVLLKKFLYKYASGIILQTEIARKIEKSQLKHPNLIVIPNPIPNPKQNHTKTDILKKKEKIILNVGRFIKTKQQLELIRIFAKINFDDWKLIFLGDGSELTKAKEVVKELDLTNYVKFEGNVSNVSTYYFKSDIFAFTSISEGFPNALAEALITPVASIAFDCVAGPSDLIENEFNGALIPNNNFELYSLKLKELMLDDTLREKYRKNSTEVMKKFNFETVMNKFYEVLTV